MQDDETLRLYTEESVEHLTDIENDLLAIEDAGADIDEELVNKVFRAAHTIKGGAGFMGLNKIKELSHNMENVLDLIRQRELVPNPEIVNILLLASDSLRERNMICPVPGKRVNLFILLIMTLSMMFSRRIKHLMIY
ncbi:MAG: Hpt domain-containing protein [Deltaproteobacteria bacterium]|nr:Hpt domain-containing protein [Deltaproteobacteria bacterium]